MASDIATEVDVLRAIQWIQQAWYKLSEITIKKCFEKCGVVKFDVEDDISADSEFDALVKELCDQTTPEEFVSLTAI